MSDSLQPPGLSAPTPSLMPVPRFAAQSSIFSNKAPPTGSADAQYGFPDTHQGLPVPMEMPRAHSSVTSHSSRSLNHLRFYSADLEVREEQHAWPFDPFALPAQNYTPPPHTSLGPERSRMPPELSAESYGVTEEPIPAPPQWGWAAMPRYAQPVRQPIEIPINGYPHSSSSTSSSAGSRSRGTQQQEPRPHQQYPPHSSPVPNAPLPSMMARGLPPQTGLEQRWLQQQQLDSSGHSSSSNWQGSRQQQQQLQQHPYPIQALDHGRRTNAAASCNGAASATEHGPSIGSRFHSLGTCKPCLFRLRDLCFKGTECAFCHYDHTLQRIHNIRPSKKTRVWLERRARQMKAAPQDDDTHEV